MILGELHIWQKILAAYSRVYNITLGITAWELGLSTLDTADIADTRTLVVGRTQSSFGDRTFAAAAPRLWNSLPSDIRQPDMSYGLFRQSLKTFLFGQ